MNARPTALRLAFRALAIGRFVAHSAALGGTAIVLGGFAIIALWS